MDFKRIGSDKVRCKISEEEIQELGYSLEEIMQNGERTKAFMDHVFSMAEEEFHIKFASEVRAVKAEILPDHSMIMTFSNPSLEEVLGSEELIKDLIGAIAREREQWGRKAKEAGLRKDPAAADASAPERTQPDAAKEAETETEKPQLVVMLVFGSMDRIIRFARQMPEELIPKNALYKYKKRYYLRVDLTDFSDVQVRRMSMITDEYIEEMFAGAGRSAYIEEHGEILIASEALEQLRQL